MSTVQTISRILWLSCYLTLSAYMPTVQAQEQNATPKAKTDISPSEDLFLQSTEDLFEEFNKIQQTMNHLMRTQLSQIHNSHLKNNNFQVNTLDIKTEERKDELVYTIKQPEGTDSKVKVSVKDDMLIIDAYVMEKKTSGEGENKSISYSQSSFKQALKFPAGYDPNSMQMKPENSKLIVTFKKMLKKQG